MFKTTIEFDEVLRLPTRDHDVVDALVWEAFQDFWNLSDAEVATTWYNKARLINEGFRPDSYQVKIVKKGYQVTLK